MIHDNGLKAQSINSNALVYTNDYGFSIVIPQSIIPPSIFVADKFLSAYAARFKPYVALSDIALFVLSNNLRRFSVCKSIDAPLSDNCAETAKG